MAPVIYAFRANGSAGSNVATTILTSALPAGNICPSAPAAFVHALAPHRSPRRARLRHGELATDTEASSSGVAASLLSASVLPSSLQLPRWNEQHKKVCFMDALRAFGCTSVRLRARRVPRQRCVPQQPCRRSLPGSIVSAKLSGSARRQSRVRPPARPVVQPRAPAPRVTADKALQ